MRNLEKEQRLGRNGIENLCIKRRLITVLVKSSLLSSSYQNV